MRWLITVLTCCALACGSSAPDHPINETCPVQPGKPVDPALEVVYEGRTIRFCCESCVEEFNADPKKYLANLEVDKPPEAPKQEASTLETLTALREKLTPALLVTVALMVLGLVAARLRQRFVAHPPASPAGRGVERAAHLVSPAAIATGVALTLLLGLGAIAWRGSTEVRITDSMAIERTMMLDAVERVSGETYPGKVVVYRGNDERSPQLYNGGKYRTTTFTLSLRTAGSTNDLQVGDPIDPKNTMLRLEIARAPNTAPQFYRADAMQRVTLVGAAGTGPVSLAGLAVLVPDWKWEAVLKIDDVRSAGIATLCTEPPRDGKCSVHYGIYYSIRTKDGKLLPSTKLYMGSTYVPDAVPREEWLSYRPIETIPDGKNVSDPKLLGLPGSGSSTAPAPQQPIGH